MSQGISHRSYVSYIDKSREYYAASGYERPYRWARYDDVPFSPLTKPLSQCRLGVVTTADLGPSTAPRATKLYAAPNADGGHLFTDHPEMGLIDVYAAVIPDLAYSPGVHVHYQETVLRIKDGLPKLKDVPNELGGSGISVDE